MNTVFAYLLYFVFATWSPLQRRALVKRNNINPLVLATHTSIIRTLLGLLVFIFIPNKGQFIFSPLLVLLLIVTAVSSASHYLLNYATQKHVDAAKTTIIINIYTPVSIVLATLFLGESLTIKQVVGTFLLLLAVVIISVKKVNKQFLKIDKYTIRMLLAGVTLGIVLVVERQLMKMTGNWNGVLLSWVVGSIALVAINPITAKYFKGYKQPARKDVHTTAVLSFLQQASWPLLIIAVGNFSIVSSVTTFKIVIVFIASYFLLDEKDHLKRKLAGSVLALVGLLLMK